MSLVSGKQYSTEITSRKNLIINGNLDIWQRGTSVAMVEFGQEYLADRLSFYNERGTGAATQLRSSDAPTVAEAGVKFNYSVEVDITTALATPTGTKEATFTYVLEGHDYAKIAGKNATLSFWVKSNKTGTYAFALRNMVGASQRRTYTVEYTIDVADTWEKKTLIIPMTGDSGPLGSPTNSDWDYTNGQGLVMSWSVMSTVGYATTSTFGEWQDGNTPYTDNQANLFDNTANYFRMTGIQLEQGTIATDFEKRHIRDELALCQRYYQKLFTTDILHDGYNTTDSYLTNVFTFPVTMRAIPTATESTTAAINLGTKAVTDLSTTGAAIQARVTTTGRAYWQLSDIELDAEL